MTLRRAPARWRTVESAHRTLHGDARCLVECSEHDGRKRAIDLIVHDPERERLPGPRAAALCATDVVKRPSSRVETHLKVTGATEGASEENLITPGHAGVLRV